MKPVSNFALGAVLAFASSVVALSPVAAQEEQAQQPAAPAGETVIEFDPGNLTETVRDAIREAQEARAAGDTSTALARTQAAVPLIQNDDDRYVVGAELLQVGVALQGAGQTAEQTQPLLVQGAQLALESGRTPVANRPIYYKLLGDVASEAEDYPAAIAAYENAQRYSPNNAAIISISLADAYFRSGNAAAGAQAADRAIQLQTDAGQPVDASWISVAMNGAYEARDADGVARYTAMLIRNNGDDKDRVGRALLAYQAVSRLDDQGNLDLFRFMRAIDAINEPNVYSEYVATSAQRGLPGEAQAVQNEAITASAITPASAIPTPAELTASVNEDRGSLDAAAASAASAANGGPALNTADAYAGYGQYDRALELYRLAVQKGGVDAGTVNLRIGAALVAAGRPDEARPAFEAVTGSRAGLAALWLAWLDHQAGGGAAASPAGQAPAAEPVAEPAEPGGS